jgi:hypothetical protein
MKAITKLDTGVITDINNKGVIKVFSPILEDEPIYLDPTVDTDYRNQLKSNLIKLHG